MGAKGVARGIVQLIAWELLNPLLLKWKRRRVYEVDASVSGINLGCGIDNPPGWIGLDGGLYVVIGALPLGFVKGLFKLFPGSNVSKRVDFFERIRSSRILHHEFAYGLPFKDESIPAVYSSHFFEHLDAKSAEKLLRECYRVMKPGAIVRICVPDLAEEVSKIEKALQDYGEGDADQIQKYVTTDVHGYVSAYSNHRHMYNGESLSALLHSCGFRDIREFKKGNGRLRDVSLLDTRGGLHVEGVKPITAGT